MHSTVQCHQVTNTKILTVVARSILMLSAYFSYVSEQILILGLSLRSIWSFQTTQLTLHNSDENLRETNLKLWSHFHG